jgi:hypothetical protein
MLNNETIRITLDASKSILESRWVVRGTLNGAHFEVKLTDKELKGVGWLGVFNVALAALLRETGLSATGVKEAGKLLEEILASPPKNPKPSA